MAHRIIRHWWNGEDDPAARLDVLVSVHPDGGAYQVEARAGGSANGPGDARWVAARDSLLAALGEARNQLAPGQAWVRVLPPEQR